MHVSRTKDHKIIITGTIAKKSREKSFRIVIDQPHIYAGHTLAALLKKHKIAFKGSIKIGGVKQGATVLARHHSAQAKALITKVMKRSDNLYADALFKKMGAKVYGGQGTWAKGKKAVESFLANEVKMPMEHITFNDGSGLSHANKISPNDLIHFLKWMHTNSPHKKDFMETFPISGVDGSLRHRMGQKGVKSKVKAKTGSLFGVSALSGYVTPKQGSELVFVIMVNRK